MAILPVKKQESGRNELATLHNAMDSLLHGNFFNDWGWPTLEHRRWPVIDIVENEKDFVIKAEVPGCKADDIDISVSGNILTIRGEKKAEEKKREKGCFHMERSYGSFRRDLTLSAGLEPDRIEANCKDGILTVTLPKSEKAKPVKIEIQQE